MILEPRVIINAVALEAVPACPLITVPGSIVKVAPLVTAIRPAKTYVLPVFQVVLAVMLAETM